MPVEVENELKYVLRMNFNQQSLSDWKRTEIIQGWPVEGPRVRNESGEFTTNVKTWNPANNADDEDENPITEAEFNERFAECVINLQKTRYATVIEDEKWFVDFFKDDNGEVYFVMAEVEMPLGREEPNNIPEVVREATLYCPQKTSKNFKSIALADPEHAARAYAIAQGYHSLNSQPH